jgi:hypothetical protein
MYLKKLFAKNGLDIAVLGCYLNLCNPDPEQHKKIVDKYIASIRFASISSSGAYFVSCALIPNLIAYSPF